MPSIKSQLIAIVLMLIFIVPSTAQEKVANTKISNSTVVLMGKSKPINELIQLQSTSKEKKARFKQNKQKPDNFKNRRGYSNAVLLDLEHQGVDPIRQWDTRNIKTVIEPIVNIDGIGDNGSPHDPTGDIGFDYYLQAINATQVGVFNKDGSLEQQFAMNTLWSEFGSSSEGDPIILFDEDAGRWIITEFTDPANVLIAISETSDPLGSYFAYNFSTPSFPDYPKYAIWPNAYSITTNEGGPGVLHQYFLDRNAMLQGDPTVTIQRVEVTGNNNTEAGFYVSTPVDWNGTLAPSSTEPMVLALNDSSWGAIAEDAVEIYTFDIDFVDPTLTVVNQKTIVVTPYDSYPCSAEGFGFACVPQQGGSGLDAIPEVIMNIPHYRNFGTHEALVFTFVTDVTDGENLAGIRWVELRKTAETDWELFQEGTYAPDDGLDRYMSSIAIDKDGNMGLAYNVSSEEEFVGVRYTGRFANDPAGMMTVEEYVAAEGQNTINSGGRFGDYSQMSVDPLDGNTFWYTTEYANGNSGSKTRIVAFQLQRDSFDLAITNLNNPMTSSDLGATESVEVVVSNLGVNPMVDYNLELLLDGAAIGQLTVTDSIFSGDRKTMTFNETIDLSAIGEYNITAIVSHPEDLNSRNDTLSSTINKIPEIDAGIVSTLPASTCAEEVVLDVVISNLGDQPLTSADIIVDINGVTFTTVNWTGNVTMSTPATESILLNNLPIGINAIVVTIANPNGITDINTANDLNNLEIEILDATGAVILEINTDEYPEETTYTITEIESGNVVATGGPFETQFTTESQILCLSEDVCYEITMFDTYGDGICCDFGEGSYQILSTENEVLITGDGNYGSEGSSLFCPGVVCMISAEIITTVATTSNPGDGTILINAANGVGPFMYSIDNGQTFSDVSLFENLEAGSYDVMVQDANGVCQYTETILVDLVSDVDDILTENTLITVAPNPSNGYFQLSLQNVATDAYFIHVNILNAEGKLVQERRLPKYGDTFETTISLVAYPNGNYYIRYLDPAINTLTKVVKSN